MNNILSRLAIVVSVFSIVLATQTVSAQTYVRFVNPDDLTSSSIFSDDVLTSIQLPMNVITSNEYPIFDEAIAELNSVLKDPSVELLQVIVCGSTSPDGLYGDNVSISKARALSAVRYLKSHSSVPADKIRMESLVEDWDYLYELVVKSDIAYKDEILSIIKTKNWGERKTALQRLDNGRVWKVLLKDFFPKLRAVRFAILCNENTKPIAKPAAKPEATPATTPASILAAKPSPRPVAYAPIASQKDTILIQDTVYFMRQIVYVEVGTGNTIAVAPAVAPSSSAPSSSSSSAAPAASAVAASAPSSSATASASAPASPSSAPAASAPAVSAPSAPAATPWMSGFRTNLLSDVVVLPNIAWEIQLSEKMSFGLSGFYTATNVIYPCTERTGEDDTRVYGFQPELRYWFGSALQKGHSLGLHANVVWYTLKCDKTHLYQNISNNKPAYSIGLDYGYSLPLDRKNHWAIQFNLGLGYGRYTHDKASFSTEDKKWYSVLTEPHTGGYFGITRAQVNLCYRFSLRRYEK